MSDGTKIEWSNATWNPTTGCSLVSEGCRNCYAMRQARRFDGQGRGYDGTTELTPKGPRWTGKVNLHPDRLEIPLRWRKPRRVFVDSMSDLFHEDVPASFVDRVFAVMALTPQHTYQVLTKRPERMAEYLGDCDHLGVGLSDRIQTGIAEHAGVPPTNIRSRWPLPNVWLGTSVENQETADERIPHLLRCPAAVRFLSCEPLLGPLGLAGTLRIAWQCSGCGGYFAGAHRKRCPSCDRIDYWTGSHAFNPPQGQVGPGVSWVIVGGESGPGARPFDIAWARDLIQQCRDAGVPCFVKQLGAQPFEEGCEPGHVFVGKNPASLHRLRDRKGGDPQEWPADLWVREFPEVAHA